MIKSKRFFLKKKRRKKQKKILTYLQFLVLKSVSVEFVIITLTGFVDLESSRVQVDPFSFTVVFHSLMPLNNRRSISPE